MIQLARQLGYTVEEVDVAVSEAMQADEIFTTGTAVVVSVVGSLTHRVLSHPSMILRVLLCPLDSSVGVDAAVAARGVEPTMEPFTGT